MRTQNLWLGVGILCLAAPLCGEEAGIAETLKLPEAAVKTPLRSVYFADDKKGWIVGGTGLIFATVDGGATWTAQESGSKANLRGVRFKDPDHGWVVGEGDPAAPAPRGHVVMGRAMKSGTLLSTEDGGKTWKGAWVPTNFDLSCVEVSTAPILQVGVMGTPEHQDSSVTRTTDGGAKWDSYRCFRALYDIRALDDKHWVAVGARVQVGFMPEPQDPLYQAKTCRALYSRDEGKTWKVSKGSEGNPTLRGLAVKKGEPVIAVGDGGTILHSEDFGETWAPVEAAPKVKLRAAAFAGDELSMVVAVGVDGGFYASTDSGRTWKPVPVGQAATLNSVVWAGDGFVAVGDNGTAIRISAKKIADALAAAKVEVPAPPVK